MNKKYMEWDLYIAEVAMFILVCLTIIWVVFRYLLNNPITWLEEVQVILIVWTCFLGASAAFRTGKHMCMEFIYEKTRGKLQTFLDIFILSVSIFTLSIFGYQAIKMISAYTTHNRVSSTLHIPSIANYCVIPICCATMIINDITSYIKKYINQKKSQISKPTEKIQ